MPSNLIRVFALLGSAAAVLAFQEVAGPSCSGTGTACSYSYIDSNDDTVTVTSTCAANGFCADNGATCTIDDNCYDYCGTDGTCGGLGASCDSQAANAHNQFDITCDTPAFVCSTDGSTGSCISATSGGSSKTRHRRMMERSLKQARSLCFGEAGSNTVCPIFGGAEAGWECVNISNNLERCGGCVSDGLGQDCTTITGALDVACANSTCEISSCQPGFKLFDGLCVEL